MELQFGEIKDYYQRNFGSGPRLYQHFRDQIAREVATLGLNWQAVEDGLSWQASVKFRANSAKFFLNRKGFKTHAIYANYRTIGPISNGIEVPMISVASRGQEQADYVFDGWAELKQLAESDRGLVDLSARQKSRLDDAAKKMEQRAAKAAAKAAIEAIEREQARVNDVADFLKLSPLQESGYLDKKRLWGILPHCEGLKQGANKNGRFTAIPLYSLKQRTLDDNGPVYAVQRIYDQPFMRSNGELTDKEFSFGMDKLAEGVHTVIGNISTASVVYWCEGWATGGKGYLAHLEYLVQSHGEAAVVVCLDSGHLPVVMAGFAERWPWILDKSVTLLDNDRHKAAQGKGNAGLLTGYQLLESWPKLKCQVPNFEEADAAPDGTDFDDLSRGHPRGLREVADQISRPAYRLTPIRDSFERALALLPLTPAQSLQQAAERAGICGANSFPVQRSIEQIKVELQLVFDAHPWMKPALKLKELADRINRHIDWRRKKAHLFRSFGPRVTRKSQRPDHIRYHKFNETEITPEIAAEIQQWKGLVIVRAGMGSGKTQRLCKPIIWGAERAGYFAHRVSLIGSAHGMLTSRAKDGSEDHVPGHVLGEMFHYHERDMFRDLGVKKLCACINSIGKEVFDPILAKLDVLVIDEASQTLKAITNGGTMKYPLTVYNRLKAVAANARQVLLLDADANDDLVSWAEHVRDMRGDNLPVHVVELTTDCSHLTVYHAEINAVFADIIEQVGKGKRCLVADDSADEGERLAHTLREKYPELKGLFISQDTKSHNEDVAAFNDAPSREIYKYDWVIYSPAISSGVSIEAEKGRAPRMDLHYGLFRGVISPSDAVQMIRRDRNAHSFVLGLGKKNGFKTTDEQAYWRATVRAMAEQGQDLEVSFNTLTGAVELASGNLEFDQMRIRQVCQENLARNDFANVLLLQLMADRYRVKPLDMQDIESMTAQGELAKQAAGKALAIIDELRILEATTPTPERHDKLKKQLRITPDERAELERWSIENYLQQPVSSDSISWLRKGGLSHAKRFELLQMTEERARRLDKGEEDQGLPFSTRAYLNKSRLLLQQYLTTCGIDLTTGQGSVTQVALQAGMELLMGEADFIAHYCSWCPPLKKRRRGGDLFKAICDHLNLITDSSRLPRRSQGGAVVWQIEPSSWEFMMDVHQAREYNGVTSFEEWRPRLTNRPVRLLLGIGKATLTMQTIAADKAAACDLMPIKEGIYVTPGLTHWRSSPEAMTLAPQPPHPAFIREAIRLATPARVSGPTVIHDSTDDLTAHSGVVDPAGSAPGSVLLDVMAMVRGVATGLSCSVREVLGLLSTVDMAALEAGDLTRDGLEQYVASCRASHGPLFGRGV